MMPLPGLQIYLRPRVTLNFDLLTSKAEHVMPLKSPRTICADLHQNMFIRFYRTMLDYRRMSVRLSVTFHILSKRLNLSSEFFIVG